MPGISIGHNGSTAFGLTIFAADQEDVYVYETREGDPDAYRHGDGWQRIERVDESFAVKGHPDQSLRLSFTRHGPVLHEDAARRRVVAMRTVWHAPGSAAYLGSLSYMRAGSVRSFADTLGHWGSPAVNHVSADVAGNIGWFTAGFTPRRPNWQGLLPVPGDGSHEWQGFLPVAEMPRSYNPAEGFVASANEMNLPADRDPAAPSIGHEWPEVSRARRIRSVLAEDPRHGVEASMALQIDVFSRPARLICATLARVAARHSLDREQARAFDLLAAWNHRLDAGSAAAALFEVWWMKHLRPGMLARFAPDPKVRKLLLPGDFDRLIALLQDPVPHWTPDERDALVLSTLAAGFGDCSARLGADPAGWSWGRLHRALLRHAASAVGAPAGGGWDVGPYEIGGSRSTVMNAGYRPEDFGLNSGASVRLVMDVGDWDNSRCINMPGQSGDPRSTHYRDLAGPWSQGRFVPLLYSPARIAEATIRRIVLRPATA